MTQSLLRGIFLHLFKSLSHSDHESDALCNKETHERGNERQRALLKQEMGKMRLKHNQKKISVTVNRKPIHNTVNLGNLSMFCSSHTKLGDKGPGRKFIMRGRGRIEGWGVHYKVSKRLYLLGKSIAYLFPSLALK